MAIKKVYPLTLDIPYEIQVLFTEIGNIWLGELALSMDDLPRRCLEALIADIVANEYLSDRLTLTSMESHAALEAFLEQTARNKKEKRDG